MRDGSICLDTCPCHADCFDGCDNCENWACQENPSDKNTTILIVMNREESITQGETIPLLFNPQGS